VEPIFVDNFVEVYCGDCLDVLEQLKGKYNRKVRLLLTDPPYFVREVIKIGRSINYKYKGSDILSGGWEWDTFNDEKEYFNFIEQRLNACLPLLVKNASLIIFFDRLRMGWLHEWAQQNNIKTKMDVGYILTNATPRARKVDFRRAIHSAYWGVFGNGSRNDGYVFNYELGQGLNYIMCSNNNSFRIHPTEKPLDVLVYLIMYLTNEGDIVLDPFAGSLTTGIACVLTNRKAILIEKDEKMIEKSIERYRRYNFQPLPKEELKQFVEMKNKFDDLNVAKLIKTYQNSHLLPFFENHNFVLS